MTPPAWVTTPCTTCGADSGERCTDRAGEPMTGFLHVARVRASLHARTA